MWAAVAPGASGAAGTQAAATRREKRRERKKERRRRDIAARPQAAEEAEALASDPEEERRLLELVEAEAAAESKRTVRLRGGRVSMALGCRRARRREGLDRGRGCGRGSEDYGEFVSGEDNAAI